MGAKKVSYYLRTKDKNVALLQVRIMKELREKASKKMKKEGSNWTELITACLKMYIDEKR